jgi:hypothetical protein
MEAILRWRSDANSRAAAGLVLTNLFQEDHRNARSLTIEFVGLSGPAGKQFVPALKFLAQTNLLSAPSVVRALKLIDPAAAQELIEKIGVRARQAIDEYYSDQIL